MKKLIFSLILVISLLSLVSAALSDDVASYYTLNETTGDVTDSLGAKNGTIITQAGYELARGVSGKINNAYNFTADSGGTSGSYVNITNVGNICNKLNCTISLWVNFSVSGSRSIFYIGQSVAQQYLQIYTFNNALGYTLLNSSGQYMAYQTSAIYANNDWNHIVLSMNQTDINFYINNTLLSTQPTNTTTFAPNLGLQISGRPGGDYLRGMIDEVGLWNRGLTTTEVASLWNGGNGVSYLDFSSSLAVSLTNPTDGFTTTVDNFNFTASVDPSSTYNLTNATLWLYNTTALFNNTEVNLMSGQIGNTTGMNVSNLPADTYTWNILVCGNRISDNLLTCKFSETNNTLTIQKFSIDSVNWVNYSLETKNETFTLSISTVDTAAVANARFIYNTTSYLASGSCSGGNCSFSKTVDLPLVDSGTSQTQNFKWQIEITDSFGDTLTSNTSLYQQVVNRTYLESCSATAPTPSVNFSIWKESDPTTALSSTFKGNLEWYFGSGSIVRNQSFSNSASESHTFCIANNQTHYTDISLIDLSVAGYVDRGYSFVNKLFNETFTEIPLYLLNNSADTSVIIEVKDQGLSPIRGYLVEIERYYPDTNTYRLVESEKTDFFGQIVASLVENKVRYRFSFYDTSNVLVKRTTNDVVVACESSICVLRFVLEDVEDDLERFELPDDYTYTLTWNNNTELFTFTWNDNSGDSPIHNLYVERIAGGSKTVVCNINSTSLIGTLPCDVTTYGNGSYTAHAFRWVGSEKKKIDMLSVLVNPTFKVYGLEGLMWAMLITLTMLLLGLYSPQVGIVMFALSFTLLGALGIFPAGWAANIAVWAISAIFIWALRS